MVFDKNTKKVPRTTTAYFLFNPFYTQIICQKSRDIAFLGQILDAEAIFAISERLWDVNITKNYCFEEKILKSCLHSHHQ